MLQMQLKTLYLWWIDWDFSYAKAKWVILEITPPREVLAPFKAMEDVFSSIWPLIPRNMVRRGIKQWAILVFLGNSQH